MKRITLTPGQRFGRLTVLPDLPKVAPDGKNLLWPCICDCGSAHWATGPNLTRGAIRSCGCLRREIDANSPNKTHGLSHRVPEYTVWAQMRNRCLKAHDPGYPGYGGRGITLCEAWGDFGVFYRDMGPRPSPDHTLDRIDNNGPYSPENCRWATPTEQARNRRSNRLLTLNGRTLTLAEWGEVTGIPRALLSTRIRRGWSDQEALTTPVKTTWSRHPRVTSHGRPPKT